MTVEAEMVEVTKVGNLVVEYKLVNFEVESRNDVDQQMAMVKKVIAGTVMEGIVIAVVVANIDTKVDIKKVLRCEVMNNHRDWPQPNYE